MAFDAGMLAAVASEISSFIGARLEKIAQPEKDEVILSLHHGGSSQKLSVCISPSSSRINFTACQKDNPLVPPMFCTLLRKHLSSAKLCAVSQPNFERMLRLSFSARDEMGFDCERVLIVEIMGKYSNLVLCDGEDKILGVLRPVDFTTSSRRQVLSGMKYELPPSQNKYNPLTVSKEQFFDLLDRFQSQSVEKWILQTFCGISKLIAREIAYAYGGSVDCTVDSGDRERLWLAFDYVMRVIRNAEFSPVVIYNQQHIPVEYAFLPIAQYGNAMQVERCPSASAAIEDYFFKKEQTERIHQRGADIFKILSTAKGRLERKIAVQHSELAECAKKEENKHFGDLITANLYQLRRGAEAVSLTDYSKEDCPTVVLQLDSRLSPAQNAQFYYKLYNKAKRAEAELQLQIAKAEAELLYLNTVEESLRKSENESDLSEIREELYHSGYASKMKKSGANAKKHIPKPLRFCSSNGYLILCGKNNVQNDYISMKVASKQDYWFHVKNMPGSHVILVCSGKDEPKEIDFTEAGEIAAYYSKARESTGAEVDYTLVKNLKKPSGAVPGYVIYHTNYSAYVKPKNGNLWDDGKQ